MKPLLFIFSYILVVITTTQLVLYLNYRTIGYSWTEVSQFIVRTPDFWTAITAFTILTLIVFDLIPSRFPFS